MLTLSKGGKDFSTTFVSDPRAFGEPTVTQVFSALADDALTLRKYSTDEFVDKLYAQGVKPSAALRAYDSCKETNLWMQNELYLSGWEIEEISKTLTKHEDEVNTLVEKAASERAERYAYDHPKLPKGFVTIEQLQGDLDLGDLRDEVEDFDFDGDLTEAFSETADYKVDDKDKVVAFESLSLNGKELASHADIEDKSQTVTITKPEVGTTAKDGLDGNKTVVSDTEVSVVDTVKYKNVTPGKTYKVSGTLYEKVTDKDGNEHPKAATPPARTEPKANAVGKIPSVEEVMAKWGCDRETAQGYIDENMY